MNNSANSIDKSTITCHYCHKEGHYKWDCRQLKRKTNKQSYKENKNSTNLHEGYESTEVLVASVEGSKEE